LLRALKSPIVGRRVRYSSSLDAATFNALAIFSRTTTVGLRTPRSTPLT
jgi:hypothetical protein